MLQRNRTFMFTSICMLLAAMSLFLCRSSAVYSHPAGAAYDEPMFQESVNRLLQDIEVLRTTHSLTEQQTRRLELAAKGAAKMHVRHQGNLFPPESKIPKWAAGLEMFYCQQDGTTYLGDDAIGQCLLHHPLWRHAVSEVTTEEDRAEEKKRKKFQHHYVVETLLLVIDSQLRLTEQQRKECRLVFTEIVEKHLNHIYCCQTNWLLIPAATGVDELPIATLAEFLRPDQVERWRNSDSMTQLLRETEFDLPQVKRGGGGFRAGGGFF